MAGETLNTVITKVTIKGEEQKFVELELHQKFNAHHTFTVIVNYLSPKNTFQQDPNKFIQYIGESINIVFSHKKTGETNEFNGTITQVEMIGSEGETGGVAIHGYSPTILYENNKTLNSWTDKTLKVIADEAKAGIPFGLTIKPLYLTKIPYIAQYKETVFNFLNRLSCIYGEWFYYDGKQLFFGNPNNNTTEKVVYDIDLFEVRLVANLVPGKYTGFGYKLNDGDEWMDKDPAKPSLNEYQEKAHGQSEKYYPAASFLSADSHSVDENELKIQMDAIKKMSVPRLVNIQGIGKTCRVRIGEIIDVSFPPSMKLSPLGTYRVTEITHVVNRDGHYCSRFVGIPSASECIPMDEVPQPVALPELAVVTSNNDEKKLGRVQVQLDWQKKIDKKTNWIRVQSTNAGSSDKVPSNRGYMFVPEEGDRVMINYEQGDPSRPYVAGSVYTSKTGQGGDVNNKIKSITTRSGSRILFDDEEGCIIISDQTGEDMIVIDGKDSITVKAAKTITLTNGDSTICIDEKQIGIMAEEIAISASKALYLNSKEQQITIAGDSGISGVGDNISMEAGTAMVLKAPKGSISSDNLAIEGSAEVDISGGLVKINS